MPPILSSSLPVFWAYGSGKTETTARIQALEELLALEGWMDDVLEKSNSEVAAPDGDPLKLSPGYLKHQQMLEKYAAELATHSRSHQRINEEHQKVVLSRRLYVQVDQKR